WGLRSHLQEPVRGHGDSGPTDLSSIALAKWLCGTSDWHIAPRVPGSNAHLRRGAPKANSLRLCSVLQSIADALILAQGCTARSSDPTIRYHCRHSHLSGTAPSLRADLIFGRDRGSENHVRFPAESGHSFVRVACPLWVNSGRARLHSITSSGLASTAEVIVTPMALVVLRLPPDRIWSAPGPAGRPASRF